jgi:hypothetical protein
MQINISKTMHEILLNAVKYTIDHHANIWSGTEYQNSERAALEEVRGVLENEVLKTDHYDELKAQIEVNRRLAKDLINCRLELAKAIQALIVHQKGN